MPEPLFFHAPDGVRLAYRQIGEGRPLLLLHGFISTATMNWLRYGHAQSLAAQGFRVIMPDLRAHGDSAKPHESGAYPPDVLADDGLALIEALRLERYDLGGYSLGARTTVRMLVRGARPRRAVLAGMGLEGIVDAGGRSEFFRRVLTSPVDFPRGSAEWMAHAFLKSIGADPAALLKVLDTALDTPRDELRGICLPALVTAGSEDRDNGSAAALAEALPGGIYVELPGTHMSAVTKPNLATAIGEFLRGT